MSSSLSPARLRLVFALLAAATGTFAALQSLISPALPVVQEDLGTTQAAVSWVLIAWLLSASVATPILGRVGDVLGKDRTLVVVLGAIALGSLVAALAPNLTVLIIGRVIQGLGGAVYPVSFGIVRDEFPPARVPSAVGAISSVIAVGGGIGTALAGPIVATLGWRWLFGLPLIVVLVVGTVGRRFIPPSPVQHGARVNLVAAALLASWLVALLLPVSTGAAWGWTSPVTLTLLAVSVVLLVAWATYETRSRNPLIDMKIMSRRPVWATNAVAFLFGAAMFSVVTYLPQFFETPSGSGYGFETSVTAAGLLMLPLLAAMAAGGLVSGPIQHRLSFKGQLVVGSALLGVGALGFALWTQAAWQLAAMGAVFGFGLGIAYAAMTSVIVNVVPATQTGAATGINTNIRNIGGAVGTAVFTGIITATEQGSGFPTATGYTAAFLTLAGVAAVAVGFASAIPRGVSVSPRSDNATGATTSREIVAPVTVWDGADEDWRS